MLAVGLTGGIGSGKSTVAEYFSKLGIPQIDADELAREITRPHTPAWQEIKACWGPRYFHQDGRLDRKKLGQTVFANKDDLQALESILHPEIRNIIQAHKTAIEASSNAPYYLIAIPLLVEKQMFDLIDVLIVVDIPENIQIQRVTQRDHLAPQQVRKIIAQQASRELRRQHADIIINNAVLRSQLADQITAIDHQLRQYPTDKE